MVRCSGDSSVPDTSSGTLIMDWTYITPDTNIGYSFAQFLIILAQRKGEMAIFLENFHLTPIIQNHVNALNIELYRRDCPRQRHVQERF